MKSLPALLKQPMTQNFFALVLLQGVNYLLPLVTFPYLFRMLGVERWGLVAFGYTAMQYLVMLTDFGFNLSATKFISINKIDNLLVNRYVNAVFVCRMILAIAALALLAVLIMTLDMFRQDAAFFIAYFGIVVGNILFPMWYFQGMEKMKYITLFNIVAKTVSCLPFFVFVRKPADYALVPYFYSLGFILAGIISIYIIYGKEKRKWMMPTVKEIEFALKDSFTYFLSRISVSMYTYVNTFVIGLAGGNVAIGYYSAAEKLYQAYNNLIIPLSGVLFPHIAKTRNVKFFRKLLKIIVPSNVVFITLAMVTSWYIVYFMYGTTGNETLTVFRILLVACLATIPSMLMGYPFLAAMGHAKYTNLTLIGASMLHVAGLAGLYFMGMLNIYTVAGMVVVTEMTVCALRIGGIVKYKLLAGKVLMKN